MLQKTKEIKSKQSSSNQSKSNKLGFLTGAVLAVTTISTIVAFSKTSPSDETILKHYSPNTEIRRDCMPKQKDYLAQNTQQDTTKVLTPQTDTKTKIAPTLQKIKNDVDAVMFSDFCTDEIAKIISQKSNPSAWIKVLGEAKNEIVKAAGLNAGVAFVALETPDIAQLFIQNPQVVVHSFSQLAKSTGDSVSETTGNRISSPLYFLQEQDTRKLFLQNPQAFGQIAEVTGKAANSAFNALKNPAIAQLFLQNPQIVIESFSRITKAEGDKAGSAFYAFNAPAHQSTIVSPPAIANLFVQNPQALGQLAEATGESAYGAFYALAYPNISELFLQNPRAVIESFSQIAKATGKLAGPAFYSLENPDINKLFLQNPRAVIESFSQIAQAIGKSAEGPFFALHNPKIGKLFVQNPMAFIELAQATGNYADNTFYSMRMSDGGLATGLTKFHGAFFALENPDIAQLFIQNPQVVIQSLSQIAKASGIGANEALDVLSVGVLSNPNIGKLFAQDPARFVKIAQENGEHTAAAFEALVK